MKQKPEFIVRHRMNGSPPLRITEPYKSAGNAEREALSYAEKQARMGHIGMLIEVVNTLTETLTWAAKITAKYQIELAAEV